MVGVAVAGAAITFLAFMVIPSRGQVDPDAQRPDGPAINAPGVVDVAETKSGGHPINRIDEPLLIGEPSRTPDQDVALAPTDAATDTPVPQPTATKPAPTNTAAPPPPPTATVPSITRVPPTPTPLVVASPTDPAQTATATATVPPIEPITTTPTETPGGPTATPDLTKTATDGPTPTKTPKPKRTRTPTPNPTGDTTPDPGTPTN
jgi:hypothetical protein